jgi:hypothetical protein
MIHDQVQDQFHTTLMELVLELVDIINVSIDGVYSLVVADVISLSALC